MNLIKQNETLTHKAFQQFSQIYTEADVIVPDIKPDIARILQANADAFVTSKSISGDKLTFEGQTKITMLYIAETGGVRSITVQHPFRHSVDAKGAPDNAQIDEQLCVQNVETLLVNSRKFCAKVLMGLDVSLILSQELEFTTGVEGDDDAHLQRNLTKITTNYRRSVAESEILARDVLEVPAGKASIGEILRTDVRILGRESKAAGNKVLIKGDVCVSTLYLADSDESVHCMEHQLPFSEIISIDEEAGDGAEIVPEYHVLNLSWNPQQDMDGDRRLLGADVNIRAILRLEQNISAEVLNDVYSTRKNLDVVRDSVNVTSAVAKTAGTVIASDIVTIDEGAPEIQQIYNVIANTKIANARCEGGKIAVEGLVDAEVLYLSNSADTPICSVHKEIRFMQTLDTIGSAAGSDAICDVQADLSHLSYTLNLAGEVELRATIALDVQALEQKEYQYVVNIEEREDEAPDRHQPYCLRVYFVREGDTAWNIAKRYKINLNDFTARNGTELAVGQRLILQG